MATVTHEQVNLTLHLYELRREPRLREAREWYMANYSPKSMEDAARIAPPGSKENAFARMVISYWNMVAGIVNRGLIDEEFFFEQTGEQWFVWECLKPVAGDMRKMFKSPKMYSNLEEHVRRLEAWREKSAPGSTEAMRQFIAQMSQARKANA